MLVLLLTFINTCADGADIDAYFRQYAIRLPDPATASEFNGIALKCTSGEATYALLDACARKIPLDKDEDLLKAIPWLKHEDAGVVIHPPSLHFFTCIRAGFRYFSRQTRGTSVIDTA
jgi:hypothetical protein